MSSTVVDLTQDEQPRLVCQACTFANAPVAVQCIMCNNNLILGINNQQNVNLRRARRYWGGRVLGNRLRKGDNSENITDFFDLVEPMHLQRAFVTTFRHSPQMIPLLFGEALQSNNFKVLIFIKNSMGF